MSERELHHILVPVDFSPHSALAVRWAARWQQTLGGAVTVLHSRQFEPPLEFTMEQLDDLVREARRSKEETEAEVRAFLARELGRTPDWRVQIEEGSPIQAILERAGQVDLVIMGTHGRKGARRWMLGSVAESVLHEQRVATLVVRQTPHTPVGTAALGRILVPTHRTAAGGRAVEYAARLAKAHGAELVVVTAVEDAHPAPRDAEGWLPELPGVSVRQVVRHGRASEQIIALAGEVKADLIVLNSDRKPFLDVHIMPPTIAQVLRYGETPVLVLPNGTPQAEGEE